MLTIAERRRPTTGASLIVNPAALIGLSPVFCDLEGDGGIMIDRDDANTRHPKGVFAAAQNALRNANSPAFSDRVGQAILFIYLCVVLVSVGAASLRFGFFPGKQLSYFFNTLSDVRSLISLQWQYRVQKLHPSKISWPAGYPARATVEPRIGKDSLTLVQAFRGDSYGLVLVDADGGLVHEWRIPDETNRDLAQPKDRLLPGDFKVIDGAHLYPNGDVVFTVDYYGVAKIDRCSNKIWTVAGEYHHSLSVDPAGDLWVPFREFRKSRTAGAEWISAPYFYESVARLSPDGEFRESFPLVDAAVGGRFEGLFAEGSPDTAKTVTSDITHLNDADIVGAEFAALNPHINEGDIVVSMRTIDSIAVIDRQTRKFKFALSGLTLRQHDPDLLPNGNILIYDNRTERSQHNHLSYLPEGQGLGHSRIVEINPRTQETVWSYEGAADSPFFSSIQGKIEPLENGNVLIVEPEGGRAFEVDRETKEIVWQFANLLEMKDGSPVYGRVTGATRHNRSDLDFLKEPACAVTAGK